MLGKVLTQSDAALHNHTMPKKAFVHAVMMMRMTVRNAEDGRGRTSLQSCRAVIPIIITA